MGTCCSTYTKLSQDNETFWKTNKFEYKEEDSEYVYLKYKGSQYKVAKVGSYNKDIELLCSNQLCEVEHCSRNIIKVTSVIFTFTVIRTLPTLVYRRQLIVKDIKLNDSPVDMIGSGKIYYTEGTYLPDQTYITNKCECSNDDLYI